MATLFFLTGRAWTDANGNPYPAATALFTTVADVNQDTYTTAGESVANANPVVSDASTGIFPDIYLAAKRYKCVIKDASGNTLFTYDIIDGPKVRVYSASEPSPAFPGMEWVDTDTNVLSERNVANDGWNNRGDADAAANAASVTEVLAGTATGKAVTPDALAGLWQRGDNLTPSGGTVTLPAGGGGVFNVAAGNFSAISSAVGGRPVLFVFGGASTITHNATSMILPGGANITTEAGDCALFVNEAATDASSTNWRCVWFQRDSTTLAAVPNYAASQAEQETGTSLIKWVTSGRQHFHDSALKGWMAFDGTGTPAATDQYNFASGSSGITDGGAGLYTLTFTTALSTAAGYAAVGMCNQVSAGNTTANHMQVNGASAGNVLAASCQVTTGNANTGSPADENYNGVIFAGDI